MRDLKQDEAEKVHKKLTKFIGQNVEELLQDPYVLQLHEQKVFFISKSLIKNTSQIGRKSLICAGTILGKFTKTNKFRISIACLHTLEKFSLHKIWLKSSAEMNFLYGRNVLRSHMHKITDNTPKNSVVFVYNQNNTPLGFGVTSKSSADISSSQGNVLIVINQADTGAYLRDEMQI